MKQSAMTWSLLKLVYGVFEFLLFYFLFMCEFLLIWRKVLWWPFCNTYKYKIILLYLKLMSYVSCISFGKKVKKNISSPFILADYFAVCRELSHISSFEITTTCQETYYYYTHFTVNETIRSILYPRFYILTVHKYRFQVRDYLHQSQHKLAALSSPEFLWFMVLPHY